MAVFKILRDELYETWWRDYFEVEAKTLEEAIQLVREGDVEAYDTETIPNLDQDPVEVEYLYEGEVVYHEKA